MKSYELIKLRLQQLKIRRSTFAAEGLGYKNINKGLRQLENIMAGGEIPVKHLQRISSLLQVSEEELIDSMIETIKENIIKEEQENERIEKDEREKFRPYFYSINERSVPSPIIIGNMVHHTRFVYYYKEFKKYTLREQLVQIKFDIADHYFINKGSIPAFGKILYYVYRNNYDLKDSELTVLDTSGEIIEHKENLRVNEGSPAGIYIRKRKHNIENLLQAKKMIIDRRN